MNQSFFNRIPRASGARTEGDQSGLDQAQLQEALQNMLQHAAGSGAPALNMFAQLQQRRAARATSLAKSLGKDHPDSLALNNQAAAGGEFKTRIDIQVERLERAPGLRPNEWIVFGTVTQASGAPATGLTVRLFDRDHKLDDLLGETETDDHGEFSIIYHQRDFAETGENRPELYLMVADKKGSLLYSSRDQLRFEAGRSEYFAITLQGVPSPKDGSHRVKRSKK